MSTDVHGTDLRVVLGPPGMEAHDASSLDLRIGAGVTDGGLDGPTLITGRENVAQALILRLLTPRGSLADLGHSAYGSRLHELIGRNKDEASRALCKTYVLEVVAQEPRVVDKAVDFRFDFASEGPSEIRFVVAVQPVDGSGPLAVSMEAAL